MITPHQIDTPRGRVAWLEAGAGWPMILIHAFPLNAEMWRPQLEQVPDGWRFIAPDLPGFGRTPLRARAADGASVDDYAAEIGNLMDTLQLDDAVIAGLSMGGYIALAMYRLVPERFTGLVLADTRAQADTVEGRAARVRMREALAKDGAAAVADLMMPKLLSEQADAALVAHVRALIVDADPAGIDAAIVAMMGRPDSTPDLPRMSNATLVVAGGLDVITPVADAETMQREIPRSTLTVIAGAGHLANLEQPERFSRALSDFLLARL